MKFVVTYFGPQISLINTCELQNLTRKTFLELWPFCFSQRPEKRKMKEALFNLGFDGLVRPLAKQYANKPKQINKIIEKERKTKNLFTV